MVRRGREAYWVVLLMVVLVLILKDGGVSATLHRIGDKHNWAPGFNYTEWSMNQHFYQEDWLIFYFDRNMFDVLEVNETDYLSCNGQHFIQNLTRGAGRDVVQVNETKIYYFIADKAGGCWQGMKVPIQVEALPPAAAPPLLEQTSASSHFCVCDILLTALALVSVWLFQF